MSRRCRDYVAEGMGQLLFLGLLSANFVLWLLVLGYAFVLEPSMVAGVISATVMFAAVGAVLGYGEWRRKR